MGKLVIQNENLAAWMPINNTFANKKRRAGDPAWKEEKDYWNGVMIQLGRYRNFHDQNLMHGFDHVVLDGGKKKTRRVTRKDFANHFTWINVIPDPVKAQRNPPMTEKDVQDLFFVETPSIHGYLKPYDGGITLWRDDKLTLAVEPAGRGKVHRKFTFEWKGRARAEVFKDGKKWFAIPALRKVTIRENDGLPEGIHQDPPQRP